MDENILKEIYEQVKNGYKVAFATITKTQGSTPGKQGATIAVFEDDNIVGTVGGGMIEYNVINKCRECLISNEDTTFEYTLNDNGNIGMQCGGTAWGYIKIFKPRPKLVIIGGGHIGLALFKIAKNLDFYTVVIDDREEFANTERFVGADEVYSGDIENILNDIDINENTYVLIATRGYDGDLVGLRSIINENASYIGMIGSKKKWLKIRETLESEGVSSKRMNDVYAPVGLNISSNDIYEIAFGIMAEILVVKNKGSLEHRKF